MAGSSIIDLNDLGGSLQGLADRITALEQTSVIPVGIVAYCAGVVPNGWLLQDGSTISATRYGQLVAYLGGTTLPDVGSRVIVGIDSAGTFTTMLATGGVETVTLTGAQSGLPAHNTGAGTSHAHTVPFATGSGASGFLGGNVVGGSGSSGSEASHTHPVSAANAAAAHSNTQPYIVMRAIIKF